MKNIITTSIFTILIFAFLSSATSCVGKKKFLREVSSRDTMVMQLNGRVIQLNQEIAGLKLELAGKEGENKALRDLQDKQDEHINRLKKEIEKLTNQSLSQQQLMDITIKRKQEEIAAREQVLEGMRTTMNDQEQAMQNILTQMQTALSSYDAAKFTTDFRSGSAIFSIPEELLFRPGSITTVKSTSDILEKIAAVLNQHPEVNIMVKGHTDNQPVKNRAYADNWDFSAQRAAAVVRILTKDYYLNPSQLVAAGKGEFEPATSNESTAGRNKNRRIEFVLTPKIDKVFRMIREYSKPQGGQ
jgi:chemotaxis protein MotB